MQQKIAIVVLAVVFIVMVLFSLSYAAQVTLEWDANADPVTGYRIYSRTGADYGALPAWEGIDTTCTITVPDGAETAFVARAYVVGGITGAIIESANSNEVVAPMSKPHPPQNLVMRIITAMKRLFRSLFG